MNLTPESEALFVALANDAGNWSGTPLLGGNVEITPARRGNLTDLKKNGLLTTFESDGLQWVSFTEAGKAFAASLNITV